MALHVDRIHTYYGPSHVLHGVSLSVEPGSVTCLLGRNGAGKTTLVHTAMGLLASERGKIELDGDDITTRPPHHRSRLGMALVPQGRRVFGPLTVSENLEVARRWSATTRAPQPLKDVFGWFPRLRDRSNQRASTLSGGEQQMLATGRALMGVPHVLLMDEPSEGLAPTLVNQLGDLLLQLKESGMAILLVEQQLNFALHVSDRAYVMEKGTIAYEGPVSDLRADTALLDRYLGIA